MKQGLTEIIFILDQSGSMNCMKNDAIGGFNSFLADQQNQEGEANLTLVLFDSHYYLKHHGVDIKKAEPLTEATYIPSGSTAYFDALGKTIDDVGYRLSNTPEHERPEKVVLAVMTDGEENSSKEYTARMIKDKIQHQEEKYNWKFIFLAANQDAFDAASKIGINNYSNFNFTPQGMDNMYSTLSKGISNYRNTGSIDQMPENIE